MPSRVLGAFAAAGFGYSFMTPPTDRLRVITGAVGCVAFATMAIYGNRSRRSRLLVALLQLVFAMLLVSVLRERL